jgi:putative spermidine/putrescine transport system permease protein
LTLPFSVSILGASLGEIDRTVEDAARDLGCGPFAAFWHGVMPQMKASLIVSALMAFITSFDEVEMSLFIAKNDTNPLPIAMYNYLDQYQDPTLSAISTVLIVISFSLALCAVFAMRGKSISKVISGGAV